MALATHRKQLREIFTSEMSIRKVMRNLISAPFASFTLTVRSAAQSLALHLPIAAGVVRLPVGRDTHKALKLSGELIVIVCHVANSKVGFPNVG